MKKIETDVFINAKPETVWEVLTSFENHPKWNPFIKSISGEKSVGKKIEVSMQPPGVKRMTLRPVILRLEPNKEFRWKGNLGVKGIFDGEHYFVLERIADNQTKFIHGENFSGILVGITGKILDKTRVGFELMNRALKKECEKLSNANVR
jgi:hypothetical protein